MPSSFIYIWLNAMNDMEKLFSKEDLIEIEQEACINLEQYLDTVVLNGQSNERTIITISKNNQLIFVEGNNFTGFEHLRDRHNFFSYKNYWTDLDGKVKLDDPSKFNPQMIPIIDFVKIADSIFNIENRNITKNNRPDLFDKYSGSYFHSDGKTEMYHLLTYKDSKVVHSLFPNKKEHNIKSKLKYGKGIVTTTLKFSEGYNDLIVPYENSNGTIAYSILIRKIISEKTESLIIQKHNQRGIPQTHFVLNTRHFEDFKKFDHEDIIQFQHSNLSGLEKIIRQIDTEEENNNN